MSICLEPEELRDLISGAVPVRKCLDCDGTGFASYLRYTLKERPDEELDRPLSPQQAADFSPEDWPDYDWTDVETDICDSCKGIGYISHLWHDSAN